METLRDPPHFFGNLGFLFLRKRNVTWLQLESPSSRFFFKFKSADVRSESPSQVSIPETKGDQTQTNSVEGESLDVDDSPNDDATGSENSLSDGEFEEDKPSSRSVEDFPMPPTSHHPVEPSVYSPSTAPDQASLRSGHTASGTSTRGRPRCEHDVLPTIQSPQQWLSAQAMTRVQVSHSSIRPNDRGKEVLSGWTRRSGLRTEVSLRKRLRCRTASYGEITLPQRWTNER